MTESGPIELTATQQNPYNARPEDFPVRQYNASISEPFHGQSKNDAEAAKRSREEFNRGSVRADEAGPNISD